MYRIKKESTQKENRQMLNEYIEVREYISPLGRGAAQQCRLHRPIFAKLNNKTKERTCEFNGLERVMTMIARFFLFHDGAQDDERIMRAEAALRLWCGDIEDKNRSESGLKEQYAYLEEQYPWLENWLQKYLEEGVPCAKKPGEEKEIIEKAINTLNARRERFGYSSYDSKMKINDYKAIKYDKIIANALSAGGPLKRYYLVCEDPHWDAKIYAITKKKQGKPKDGQKDRILKTIAAYLLERNRKARPIDDGALRYEPVNKTNLSFWAKNNSDIENKDLTLFAVSGRPLFFSETGPSGNVGKIKPDSEWFAACGWQLIDGTEDDTALDAYLGSHPDAVCFSDRGSEGRGKSTFLNEFKKDKKENNTNSGRYVR